MGYLFVAVLAASCVFNLALFVRLAVYEITGK